MLHDEQLFAGIQARIGLDLLVCQRAETFAAAFGEEECAVDDVIRYQRVVQERVRFFLEVIYAAPAISCATSAV